MKYLFLFIFTFSFYLASAQVSFNTGNVRLDADLNAINTQASLNLSYFNKDMQLTYGVSERKLNYMHVSLHMAPGEIFLSLEIFRLGKVPLDRVLEVYRTHRSKGWGVIAKQLGIKPGSAEFHQLKQNASSKKSKGFAKKHKHKKKHK